jgi:hypothetical protein
MADPGGLGWPYSWPFLESDPEWTRTERRQKGVVLAAMPVSRLTSGVRGGAGALTSSGRFFYDSRSFAQISREYWSANGPAAGRSLHHWLIPQRWTWVPQGIRNAGFNLLELPALRGVFHPTLGLNQWMSFARNWGPGYAQQAAFMESALRVGVPATGVGAGYAGYEIGSALED